MLQRMTMETDMNFQFLIKVYIMILIYSRSHGGELIRISIIIIQIGDIEIMTSAYSLSGSFGSKLR